MLFDIVSDIHSDGRDVPMVDAKSFFRRFKTSSNNTLVIAGDIAKTPWKTIKFCLQAKEFYDDVVFTDGNHEFYESRQFVYRTEDKLAELAAKYHIQYLNLRLNLQHLLPDGVLIVGGNMWYDFKFGCPELDTIIQEEQWQKISQDFTNIKFEHHPVKLARASFEKLRHVLNKAALRHNSVVVVSHTVPIRYGVAKSKLYRNSRYFDKRRIGSLGNSLLQEYILDRQVPSCVKAWIYGHSHSRMSFRFADINFYTNAYGHGGMSFDRKPFSKIASVKL